MLFAGVYMCAFQPEKNAQAVAMKGLMLMGISSMTTAIGYRPTQQNLRAHASQKRERREEKRVRLTPLD